MVCCEVLARHLAEVGDGRQRADKRGLQSLVAFNHGPSSDCL
jgi:hypothetical protein